MQIRDKIRRIIHLKGAVIMRVTLRVILCISIAVVVFPIIRLYSEVVDPDAWLSLRVEFIIFEICLLSIVALVSTKVLKLFLSKTRFDISRLQRI